MCASGLPNCSRSAAHSSDLLHRGLRAAQRRRAQRHAPNVERLHEDDEAQTHLPQDVLGRHAEIVEGNRRRGRTMQAHLVLELAGRETLGRVAVLVERFDHEGRRAAARAQRRIGHGQDAHRAGQRAVGDPHLRAVEDVRIAFFRRAQLDRRRIRSGLRLGQRKRRDLFAAAQIGQVLFADVFGAAQIDRHGADADVRADDGGEAGIDAAQFFHQNAVAGLARAHAAILARKRHAEQSDLRRFLDDVQRGLAGSIGLARRRAHFFFGKFADQFAARLDVRVKVQSP